MFPAWSLSAPPSDRPSDRPSVRPSVRPSDRPSVRPAAARTEPAAARTEPAGRPDREPAAPDPPWTLEWGGVGGRGAGPRTAPLPPTTFENFVIPSL